MNALPAWQAWQAWHCAAWLKNKTPPQGGPGFHPGGRVLTVLGMAASAGETPVVPDEDGAVGGSKFAN